MVTISAAIITRQAILASKPSLVNIENKKNENRYKEKL